MTKGNSSNKRPANVIEKFVRLVYDSRPSDLTRLSEETYKAELILNADIAERAFDKAWEIRNFEIEMYWKRATYFWAFIASAFVGYFSLVNTAKYGGADQHHHAEVYFVICLGFVLSLAWHLTNRGSKQWQRHWEGHVDLLENAFTGPLYKTVNPDITFSVSKINEIVSFAVTSAWVLLALKYLVDQRLINRTGAVDGFIVTATVATTGFAFAMVFGYGRGRFKDREIRMYRRSVSYVDAGDARTGEIRHAQGTGAESGQSASSVQV